MTVSAQRFDEFIKQSTTLHEPGIREFGKRYKQHSHIALTEIYAQLADQLGVTTAIEIGAFQADFSRQFINSDSRRKALAVEANPYNFAAFKDMLADAGVLYHHAAIQDRIGTCTLELHVTDKDIENGYIRGNNSILTTSARPETKPLTVPGITLDALVSDYVSAGKLDDPAESPPILWIDAEGALSLVIAGGTETISHSLAIFAEVEATMLWDNQMILPDICAQLDTLGFIPFLRDCEYEPDQFNVIFIHRKLEQQPIMQALITAYSEAIRQPL